MRKSIAFIALALLMVFSTARPATTVSAADKTVLRMTWWGSQNRHDRTIKVVEMYEAANPTIDIVYEFAGFNDYWTKLNTQASGKNLPCLIQQDYAFIQQWMQQKLIIPLDPFVKDGTLSIADVPDAAISGGRINNQLYGVSLGINSQSVIIDLEAFEKAGVAVPKADWTWEDFEKIALQLHEKLGIWGGGPGIQDEQLWKSLYLSNGEWAFSADGTQIGYKDDAALVEYFKMLVRLMDAKALPGQDTQAQYDKAGPEGAPIVTRKSAMQYQWSNQVVAVWKASGADRKLTLVPLPRLKGGKSANYVKPSMFFSVTSQCGSPELEKEAAKFINYFTNTTEANDVLFAERGVPISTKILEYLRPKLDPATAETFRYLAAVQKDVSPIPPADPAGWPDIRTNVYVPLFVEPVLFKQSSPEDGAKTLRAEVNKILAKNKK